MNGTATAFIVLGLFLVGGIISFAKQGMSKSIIALLSIGAGMSLIAGVMRLEVWS
ncbi:amidotransferase [Streptomyces albus subsp. albus]|nr:amidotransferase [Streptomyces albus subsp. albus]